MIMLGGIPWAPLCMKPCMYTYLASQSRELEHMDGLVKDRSIVGDIDKHGDLALPEGLPLSGTNKVVLKETSQFALPERHHSLFSTSVIVRGVCVGGGDIISCVSKYSAISSLCKFVCQN